MELFKVTRVTSPTLGELPLKAKGGTFKPSSYKRETQEAESAENIGFTKTPTPAELTLTLQGTLDPSDFRDLDSDSVTIYLAGGGQHVMPQAWVTDAVELGDGELKVTFNSAKSEKLS